MSFESGHFSKITPRLSALTFSLEESEEQPYIAGVAANSANRNKWRMGFLNGVSALASLTTLTDSSEINGGAPIKPLGAECAE